MPERPGWPRPYVFVSLALLQRAGATAGALGWPRPHVFASFALLQPAQHLRPVSGAWSEAVQRTRDSNPGHRGQHLRVSPGLGWCPRPGFGGRAWRGSGVGTSLGSHS
ncbi:Conserved hypothetical protein [Micromonospora lupini str. Lupac 08]|uniref:Uncharacterized protein n=1 Tax=Micromonospora lupini str. Lupac 08 TaxID=1150864 RepID=I0KY63_9ACTN|nr:Conserved hypothetical protein [Micromonospora lupini str. Lupac 08]